MDIHSLMAEKLGSGKKGKKKAKLHMHIRPLDDGKYHVQHQMSGGDEGSSEASEHAPANLKALLDHIGQHYGGGEDSGASDSAAASPAPTATPAPAEQV
jgi:hypothetical protein